ncbi:GNAT family N-acetyltransferase [Cellulomonas sp. B6]|uniref:GNAT family N-acetyltransferase n=1 Tax=Cellulomonas sp. B6 TaxID=1295626 RepID=UPI00073BCCB9|nr:GNAT family N-acetyltransferase [Cellulomonas sp. B6]KSW14014.1 GCN5 family acetyltransferase [Cellulomonas sp. B6]
MPVLTVRPCGGPAEHAALVRLWRRAVDATHDFVATADLDDIEALLVSTYLPAVRLVVAEVDGTPAGFAGTSDGELAMLFVDPAHQGRGVGGRLLAHVVHEQGVTRVDVNEQNVAARAFYERHGFAVVGRSATDDAGRPYPLLHLRLTSAG